MNVTFYEDLEMGNYTYYVKVVDKSGNVNISDVYYFEISTPLVYMVSPAYDDHLKTTNLTFLFKVLDPEVTNASCEFYVDSEKVGENDTVFVNTNMTFYGMDFEEGEHEWEVFCDSRNGANASNTAIFTIDLSPPEIVLTDVELSAVLNGSSVIVNATVVDNFEFNHSWAQVTSYGGTVTNLSSLPDTYTTPADEFGRFNVTYFASDKAGNIVNATDWFEVGRSFSGNISIEIDASSEFSLEADENFTFRLIHPHSGDVIKEIETNGTAVLENVPDVIYNMELVNLFDGSMNLTFEATNLSLNNGKDINFDKYKPSSGYIVIYGIDTEYNFTNSEVILGYDMEDVSVESNLRLYKCSDYILSTRTCGSSGWQLISSSPDTENDRFVYETDSFSGFAIYEVFVEIEDTSVSSGGSSGSGGCGGVYHYVKGFGCVLKNETEQELNVSKNPKELFDIRMDLEDTSIKSSDELEVVVTYESFGSVPTLVNLTFEVFDSEGNLIYFRNDFIIVNVEEIRRYTFEDLDLVDGEYEFVLTTLYNIDVADKFRSKFIVGEKYKALDLLMNYWWIFILFVLIGVVLFFTKRIKIPNKRKKRVISKLKKKSFEMRLADINSKSG